MGRGSRYIQSIQYQEEKQKWEWLVKSAIGKNKPKKMDKAIVSITYYFKDRRRRDPDNYSGKFILDGLVRAGVLEDDSFSNIDLILKGKYDKKNPRVEVALEEIKIEEE